MATVQEGIAERLLKIATPQLQVAAASAALTALVAGVLISRAADKDVYVPTEKVKLKVEEVCIFMIYTTLSSANAALKLWHYPVKGLGGCRLDQATIGPQGFEDDRTFCLEKIHRDSETGEITVWETMYVVLNLMIPHGTFKLERRGASTVAHSERIARR